MVQAEAMNITTAGEAHNPAEWPVFQAELKPGPATLWLGTATAWSGPVSSARVGSRWNGLGGDLASLKTDGGQRAAPWKWGL